MWTATITRKDFEGGTLRLIVLFNNGTRTVEETFFLRRGNELDSLIKNRIAELTALDTAEAGLTLGVYTPTPDVVVPQTPLQIALSNLNRLQNLVNLGIIKTTDTEYVNALAAAKTAYSAP